MPIQPTRAVRSALTSALLLCGLTLGAGCSERTSCEKLRSRMNACSTELWNTLEPEGKGLMTARWRADRNRRHYKYCTRVKGVYKQSPAINTCLQIQDCAEFAACFCKAVKSPAECGRAK